METLMGVALFKMQLYVSTLLGDLDMETNPYLQETLKFILARTLPYKLHQNQNSRAKRGKR